MAYFFLAGYQFCQAQAVVKKLEELKTQQEDLQNKLKSFPESTKPANQKKHVESKLAKTIEGNVQRFWEYTRGITTCRE